jgi:uncharacterized protein YgiM (DUF1202 family)
MKRLILILSLAVLACSFQSLSSASLEKSPTVEPSATNLPTQAEKLPTVTVSADALHVRNEPMGVVIGYLYHADSVTLTNKCSTDPAGWAEIEWQGGTAWVNSKYLSDNICQTKEGD